ncbi:hypothetical protein FIBSPDRAFT_1037296 [Athelia psychrophila]|uniref:Uncharacterized protein n=1 Tax=Athelia psychrophila TaxID=1759441 RepID=A0A166UIW9_9AGAM|nr:hypothetical protein FIBSPDRAFT_1037296 [Fibularhizoctonia sp. CBS 109695]
MREIKGEWRQRVLLLSKRLEELSTARKKLFTQLKDLDAQISNVEQEHNGLLNLNAPTSNLPAETLAMIFEAGMVPEHHMDHEKIVSPQFGELVSHVSRRWRNIALATPRLWANLRLFRAQVYGNFNHWDRPYIERARRRMGERAAVYLSRSKTSPITIRISALRQVDFTPDFLRLLGPHMARCRRLVIEDASLQSVPLLLEYLQCQSVPLLTYFEFASIGLILEEHSEEDVPEDFQVQVFSSGAPRLEKALLELDSQYHLKFFTPALASVTSLCIKSIEISSLKEHNEFRDALMGLNSMSYLELHLVYFEEDVDFRESIQPITLPTIQFLYVGNDAGGANPFVADCIASIHATSLVSLALRGWDGHEQSNEEIGSYGHQFPSLQHLTIIDIGLERPELEHLAEKFPDIEQLTCDIFDDEFGIEDIIEDIVWSNYTKDDSNAPPYPCWPKLHTIATSSPNARLIPTRRLTDTISTLQECGHPLRKLLLPTQLKAPGLITELKEVIDIEEFCDDWPRPFSHWRTFKFAGTCRRHNRAS